MSLDGRKQIVGCPHIDENIFGTTKEIRDYIGAAGMCQRSDMDELVVSAHVTIDEHVVVDSGPIGMAHHNALGLPGCA